MAFMDKMEALAAGLFASDKFTDATITRAGEATFDPVAGTATSTEEVIDCRAVITATTVKNDAGAFVEASTVTANVPLEISDKLNIGEADFTITAVETTQPHGHAFKWVGFLA